MALAKSGSISRRLMGLDGVILLLVGILLAVGIITVFSATMLRSANEYGTPYYYIVRHGISVVFALLIGLAATTVRLETLPRLSWPLMFLTIVLLALVKVPGVGVTHRGATRWLDLYYFTFQPSELAKFTLPLFLASMICAQQNKRHGSARVLTITLPVVFLVLFLVAIEPDYSTTGLLALICGSIYFVAQKRLRHIVALGALALSSAACAYYYSHHFRQRVDGFASYLLDPASTPWHLKQAFTAMGSGGLFGMGLGKGMQKHLLLAESFNDFAFASLAEDGGFVAAVIVIAIFLTLTSRALMLSMSLDIYFARLLGFGLATSLGLQSFMNIAVVLGLMPTTGISLPFISYGGSGLLANMITVGLLVSVIRSRTEGKRK